MAGRLASGAASLAASSAPQPLPKVALLFLTRGDLPHEPAWRAFLDTASAAVQQAAPPGVGPADWRQLFSLYTHPPPNHTHPAGSLFAGREVPGRVPVQWAGHSMVRGGWRGRVRIHVPFAWVRPDRSARLHRPASPPGRRRRWTRSARCCGRRCATP